MYYKFNSSPLVSYHRYLEKSQYFTSEKLAEIQTLRLKNILQFVWDNNTFYRKRMELFGVNPTSISGPADLVKLPILSKTDVRLNSDNMFSRRFQKDQLHRAKTGGSTGRALDLYFTEECSELRNACARRHDCWAGWNPGEPIAACWGNPKYPKTIKDKLKFNLLQPYIYLDTMHVDEASIRKFLDQWRKIKPTLLYGHAHSIYQLAESIKKLEIDPPHPKGILSTSMMLIPSERKVIEAVFGLKVTDRYGCEEVSLIASECEKHHGMHLNTEHLVIEFLRDDGTPVAPGEPGRIVVTDLMNKAMPLIRYAVEDIGVPSDRICTCGRGLPLMEHVTGRVADFLLKTDGSRVAGISLIENSLTKFDGIVQMQIVQKSLGEIDLNLVRGDNYSEETAELLKHYFSSVFSRQVNLQLNYVDRIASESSGKYRFSICRIGS
jgi:phenylacetate-CoA ligase